MPAWQAIFFKNYLARLANLPTGLYILPSVISSSFFKLTENISASIGSIFTIFLPYERYLREFSRSRPLVPISQGTLPWQPILGKMCEMTFIQYAG